MNLPGGVRARGANAMPAAGTGLRHQHANHPGRRQEERGGREHRETEERQPAARQCGEEADGGRERIHDEDRPEHQRESR